MKFLLVIPQNYTTRYSYPFLGIMYLASVLKAENKIVKIFDCQTTPNYLEKIVSESERYDAVGFYTNYFNARQVEIMAKKIRGAYPEKLIGAGGPYATHQPERLIRSYADIVVLGEGEDVIKAIATGKDLASIPSIVYRSPDGGIVENKRISKWVNLDSLPFPEWDMVNYKKYSHTTLKRKPIASMMTSRGCPMQCIYCSKLIHGSEMRKRSVENVVDEIEYDHREFGVREIQFMDDNLTISVPRFKEICTEIIRRGLNNRVVFGILSGTRPDVGDQEMFNLMVRAGFYFTTISVESADKEVSSKLRRGVNLDKVRGTIHMAKRAGLIVSTLFIFGTPFDTRATMQKSIDFACSTCANMMTIFFLIPFPGTVAYDMLLKDGKIKPEDYEKPTFYTSAVPRFEVNDWTKEDLVQIARQAYRRFYLAPRRILINLLSMPRVVANPIALFIMILKLIYQGIPVVEVRRHPLRRSSNQTKDSAKV